MKCYRVRWFDAVDWDWHDVTIIADTKKDVRKWVDSLTRRDLRNQPYSDGEDSLDIEFIEDVILPYVVFKQ